MKPIDVALAKILCPAGTDVAVIRPVDADEDGWLIIPNNKEKLKEIKLPEGWEVAGTGRVTHFDEESERSKNGKIFVVHHYIYCGFDEYLWRLFK